MYTRKMPLIRFEKGNASQNYQGNKPDETQLKPQACKEIEKDCQE